MVHPISSAERHDSMSDTLLSSTGKYILRHSNRAVKHIGYMLWRKLQVSCFRDEFVNMSSMRDMDTVNHSFDEELLRISIDGVSDSVGFVYVVMSVDIFRDIALYLLYGSIGRGSAGFVQSTWHYQRSRIPLLITCNNDVRITFHFKISWVSRRKEYCRSL